MAKVWEWLWEESTNSLHPVLWQSLICGRGIPRLCVYGKHTHLDVLWGNRESHMLMLSYGTLNNLVVLWSCAMVVSCQRSQFSIWFRRPSPMCGCSTEFFLSHDDQFFRDLYLYLCYLLIVAFRKKSKLIRVLNPKKGAINSVPSLSHPNLWPWILPMPLTPVTLRLVIDKYVKFHACHNTMDVITL